MDRRQAGDLLALTEGQRPRRPGGRNRSGVRPPEHAGRVDIRSTFRIPTRAGAYRMIVTVQLPDGGRFAREAVIEPERSASLGFCMRQRTVPVSIVPDGAMQCIQAEAATMI